MNVTDIYNVLIIISFSYFLIVAGLYIMFNKHENFINNLHKLTLYGDTFQKYVYYSLPLLLIGKLFTTNFDNMDQLIFEYRFPLALSVIYKVSELHIETKLKQRKRQFRKLLDNIEKFKELILIEKNSKSKKKHYKLYDISAFKVLKNICYISNTITIYTDYNCKTQYNLIEIKSLFDEFSKKTITYDFLVFNYLVAIQNYLSDGLITEDEAVTRIQFLSDCLENNLHVFSKDNLKYISLYYFKMKINTNIEFTKRFSQSITQIKSLNKKIFKIQDKSLKFYLKTNASSNVFFKCIYNHLFFKSEKNLNTLEKKLNNRRKNAQFFYNEILFLNEFNRKMFMNISK